MATRPFVRVEGPPRRIRPHCTRAITAGVVVGDLVFYSGLGHVGIYVGEGRFVHAPNNNGKVRTESLTSGWFATRFEEARTYFD